MANILITGGQLNNKGAQAMSYTVISKLKKHFINDTIIMISNKDFVRSEEEKKFYNFEFAPLDNVMKLETLGMGYSFLGRLWNLKIGKRSSIDSLKESKNFKTLLEDTKFIIDISGYSFSSQWPFKNSLFYLFTIKIAKRYNIPMFILPQSLGPLKYDSFFKQKIIKYFSKSLFKYPTRVYPREQEGFDLITKFSNANVKQAYDIVLQNGYEIDPSVIFTSKYKWIQNLPMVSSNSVAIIPNQKIMKHGDDARNYQLYQTMIDHLLEKGKSIYLLRHSFEDLYIIEQLKSMYSDEKRVVALDGDYNCLELKEILSNFNFVIASRYHSIIHSYLEYVPAIVLGWAVKYQELLQAFTQSKYIFDVRESMKDIDLINAVDTMEENYEKESDVIRNKVHKIQENSIFDEIFNKLK